MLSLLLTQPVAVAPATIFLQGWQDALGRIWSYLNHKYYIGNLEGSVTSLVGGALILALAVLLSRTLSKLLQRRISKKAYLDPGLHYTIGKLTQYLIITLGLLLALSFGVSLDPEDVENVLLDPAPKVQFLKFGDWSLDFRLLVWTNRPRLHTQIRSDINYRIERLFRQEGIEIPFPQTELRLRGGALHLDTGDRLVADEKLTDDEKT